ncbi:protein sprouty homolog 1-like [Denticeps clupeoides]|uniref:protein sprouty homolog 1-like n=1 Tax=Denticeps clupeoides TaxID=299321 RepID=UPI0010A445FD|nr:protein sprouty homolog 1-like [Denticeps clupeoides]
MEPQSQHGTGGSLAVIQQPSPEARLEQLDYERELQRAAILSLDQIKAIRSSNEYTEGPSAARRPAPRVAPRPDKQERTHEVILVNVNNNYEPRGHHHHHHHAARVPGLSRSTSTGSSGSGGSASSEQGLLPRSPPARPGAVRTQPKADGPLKPAGKASADLGGHQFICERCGKCKCRECTAPRTLPACLACGGQCLCSAESAVENGTCMCLVKGLFYHCSNDDEGDTCADHPCSLSRSHCCSRFLCMGLMAALFPCLLCYPPMKGCVRASQGCYDRAKRPGCRCKNSNTVYCKLEAPAPRKPS